MRYLSGAGGQRQYLVRGSSLERAAGPTALQAGGTGGRSCCTRLFGNAGKILVDALLLGAEVPCLGPERFWQGFGESALQHTGVKVALSGCSRLQPGLEGG